MTETKQTSRRRGRFFKIILLILILLAGALYFIYLKSPEKLNFLIPHFEKSKAQSNQVESQLETVNNTITQLSTSIQQQAQKIEKNTDEIEQINRTTNNREVLQWNLAEIEYLLNTAALQVQYSHDYSGALLLLKTADQRLQELQDTEFNSIRNLLTQNITQLEAIPKRDDVAVMGQLSALAKQVELLPLNKPKIIREEQPLQKDETSYSQNKWLAALQQSLQALKKVVIVRRQDTPIEPMLTIEQQTLLIRSIQLLLQQAQWAYLVHKNQVYDVSLEQIQELIQHYFLVNNDATQNLLKSLQELRQYASQVQLPDITRTLQAFQKQRQQVRKNT